MSKINSLKRSKLFWAGMASFMVIVFGVAFAACSYFYETSLLIPASYRPVDAKKELGKSTLTFMSWNGEWKGTDIDTILEFFPDETVAITYCGYSVNTIRGKYKCKDDLVSIDASTADLKEMFGANDFPPLKMRSDGKDLYLYPARWTRALRYGSESAWPLKQVTLNFDPSRD